MMDRPIRQRTQTRSCYSYRSVEDYPSEDALRRALLPAPNVTSTRRRRRRRRRRSVSPSPTPTVATADESLSDDEQDEDASSIQSRGEQPSQHDAHLHNNNSGDDDWRVPNAVRSETSQPQTVEYELQRLLTLQSYSLQTLLLEEKEEESLTTRQTLQTAVDLARTQLNMSAALITIVDLGCQYVLACSSSSSSCSSSSHEEVRALQAGMETSRRDSFCAHTILSTNTTKAAPPPCMVVPDATRDPRWASNTKENNNSKDEEAEKEDKVVFYAGAPLMVPEGYNIGALCVIDSAPRTSATAFSAQNQALLQQLAVMVVQALVTHRTQRRLRQELVVQQHAAACTAHALVTPLTGLQLSLSVLQEELLVQQQQQQQQQQQPPESSPLRLTPSQDECLQTAVSCASVMRNITDSLRPQSSTTTTMRSSSTGTSTAAAGPSTTTSTRAATRAAAPCATSFVQDDKAEDELLYPPITSLGTTATTTANNDATTTTSHAASTATSASSSSSSLLLNVPELAHRLTVLMDTVSKSVPVDITVDPMMLSQSSSASETSSPALLLAVAVPSVEVFRAALSLVTYCYERSNCCTVRLHFSLVNADGDDEEEEEQCPAGSSSSSSSSMPKHHEPTTTAAAVGRRRLVVECIATMKEEKNGEGGSSMMAASLDEAHDDSDLFLVVRRIQALGGSFHVQQQPVVDDDNADNADPTLTVSLGFQIPVLLHHDADPEKNGPGGGGSLAAAAATQQQQHQRLMVTTTTASTLGRSSGGGRGGEEPAIRTQGGRNSSHITTCLTPAAAAATTMTTTDQSSSSSSNNNGDAVSNNNNKTALIIEDSKVIRKCMLRALSRLDYDVVEAEDGLVGLAKLKESTYDLVMCDFLMPQLDGMDCVSQFRSWEQRHRRPTATATADTSGNNSRHGGGRQLIVGMSAHATDKDVARACSLGMNAYRPKPVTFEDLKALTAEYVVAASASSTSSTSSTTLSSSPQPRNNNTNAAPANVHRRGGTETTTTRLLNHVLLDSADDQPRSTSSSLSPSSIVVSAAATDDAAAAAAARKKACLIVTDAPYKSQLQECVESHGLDAAIVENGYDALGFLISRNWRAVFLDTKTLPGGIDGKQCLQQFRSWEQLNRVNRQRHVYLLNDDEHPKSNKNKDDDAHDDQGQRRRRTDHQHPHHSAVSSSRDHESVPLAYSPLGIDSARGGFPEMDEICQLLGDTSEESTLCASDIILRL